MNPKLISRNVAYAIRGYPLRLAPGEIDNTYIAFDREAKIHFCRWKRRTRYRMGVNNGIKRLLREYCLDEIELSKPGAFIDCGANVGELGIWSRSLGFSYLPFEPEELEAKCCDQNNFSGRRVTSRKALWNTNDTLTFYSKPDSADSSLFEIKADLSRFDVEAVTLDSQNIELDPFSDNVLKLEAEGAEPEVLEGSVTTLRHIRYVVADCGYERGLNQDHTFIAVLEFLTKRNFRLTHCNFKKRVTAIFEREAGK
jgi:FkbM family methyltransferase